MFNESKFPFSTLSAKSFVSTLSPSSSLSSAMWLSNLLYLHSSNQPSILSDTPHFHTQCLTVPSSSTPIDYVHHQPVSISLDIIPSSSIPFAPTSAQPVNISHSSSHDALTFANFADLVSNHMSLLYF